MRNAKRSYGIDMCNGPLVPAILRFALPLALSSILQLAFNAADIIILGRFAGETSLAAVGSTGALINLLINVFTGLAVGTNVLVSNFIGARSKKDVHETVHTAILVAAVGGVGLIGLGFFLSKPLLEIMGTPEDVIDLAVLYMRIYFAGMPGFMLYTFGAAILRATGDTKRPLYYLSFAGVANVVLNLIFVLVFHMGVAGVALATIISQAISGVLVIRCLIVTEGFCQLQLKELKVNWPKLRKMMQIGLPAGIQGSLFSLSNITIQSAVNSFESLVMAGNTAANNIEGFVYTTMNSVAQASISFTSQNIGAHKPERVMKVYGRCMIIVGVVGLVVGNGAYLLGSKLLQLYTDDPAVIQYGMNRMVFVSTTYFLCGLMEVGANTMRGMGYGVLPMVVSLAGACALRILWVKLVFPLSPTQQILYISYPISWGLTALAHSLCVFRAKKIRLQHLDT